MALNISSLSSAFAQGASPNAAAQLASLVRTDTMHYTAGGEADASALDQLGGLSSGAFSLAGLSGTGKIGAAAGAKEGSFEKALLQAMDGMSASQAKSDNLLQRIVADPNSVDAQDVTIAMAEANMSLNLAKTILSRVVTAWKDVINTR
jgi:flagellar hook-basal body complex protein FliE